MYPDQNTSNAAARIQQLQNDPNMKTRPISGLGLVGRVGQVCGALKDAVASIGDFLVERQFNDKIKELRDSMQAISSGSKLEQILQDWGTLQQAAPVELKTNEWVNAVSGIANAAIGEKRTLVRELSGLFHTISPGFTIRDLQTGANDLDTIVRELGAESPEVQKRVKREVVRNGKEFTQILKQLHTLENQTQVKVVAAVSAAEKLISSAATTCASSEYKNDRLVEGFVDKELEAVGAEFRDGLANAATSTTTADFQMKMQVLGKEVLTRATGILPAAKELSEKLSHGQKAKDAIDLLSSYLKQPGSASAGSPQIEFKKDTVYVKISDDMANACEAWLNKESQPDMTAFTNLTQAPDFAKIDEMIKAADRLVETSERIHNTLHTVAESLMPVNQVHDVEKVGTGDAWQNDKDVKDMILFRMPRAEQRKAKKSVSDYFDLVKEHLEERVANALRADTSRAATTPTKLHETLDNVKETFDKFIEGPKRYMQGKTNDGEAARIGFRRYKDLLEEELGLNPDATTRRKQREKLEDEVDKTLQ